MIQQTGVSRILLAGIVIAISGAALAQTPAGNPESGAATFAGKGNCVQCHRVRDQGSRLGPDLTEIGDLRSPADLRKALLDPNREVQVANRTFRVTTKNGIEVTGKLLNQGTASIQMLDSKERLVSFQKSDLKDFGFIATPPMPSYRDKLSPEEIDGLVAWLSQLKGVSQ